MMNAKQIKRENFCIDNNLLELLGKTLSEKEALKLIKSVGLVPVCQYIECFDPEDKDNFYELTGLLLDGNRNIEKNKLEYTVMTF